MTEKEIQNLMYGYLQRQNLWPIFPNCDTITGYEADLVAITSAGYAYEYEIKVSLQDFRADRRKRHKHASLSGQTKKIPNPYARYEHQETANVLIDADPIRPMRDRCRPEWRPRKFWYVIHGFEIPEQDLPPYSGLIIAPQIEIRVPAPTLAAQKVDPKKIAHAYRNMLYRYWNLRTKQ